MTAARLILVLGITAALTLRPSLAHAQLEAFVQAVRGLADAAGQRNPRGRTDIRSCRRSHGRGARGMGPQHQRPGGPRPPRERRRAESTGHTGCTWSSAWPIASVAAWPTRCANSMRPSRSGRPRPTCRCCRALTLEAAGRPAEAGKAFRTAWHLDSRRSRQGVLRDAAAECRRRGGARRVPARC